MEEIRMITSDDVVKGYRTLYDRHDNEAAASFRFRLREAAKMALTIGDELLQMSQDASVPTDMQLKELRDLENSLDCNVRFTLRDLKPKAV